MKILSIKSLAIALLAILFSYFAYFAPSFLTLAHAEDCTLDFTLLGQPCAAFYNMYLLPIIMIVSFSAVSYLALKRLKVSHPILIPLASHTLTFLCLKTLVWPGLSVGLTLVLLTFVSIGIMFAFYFYFEKWRALLSLKVTLVLLILLAAFVATPIIERLIYSALIR